MACAEDAAPENAADVPPSAGYEKFGRNATANGIGRVLTRLDERGWVS